MKEFDTVIILEDIGKAKEGNLGCILEIFNHGESYFIEAFDKSGDSLGVETVRPNQIELYVD